MLEKEGKKCRHLGRRHPDTGHCPQQQHLERGGDPGTLAASSWLLQKLLFELVGGVRSLAG